MADLGYVRGQINGIKDADLRVRLTNIFEHILNNLRFGVPDHQARAENFQAYFENSTTASDTSEFSFQHGLAVTPKYAIPMLELDHVGSKIAMLEVSRIADSRRIYLKAAAGSTSAPILLLIE